MPGCSRELVVIVTRDDNRIGLDAVEFAAKARELDAADGTGAGRTCATQPICNV